MSIGEIIQSYVFCNILTEYLNPKLTRKQYIKLYRCNKTLYDFYLINNKFDSNYFTPKHDGDLERAVNEWCSNKEEAIIKYGNIGYWNTINIVYMVNLFYYKTEFNDNIEDWNTSNVIDICGMFHGAVSFNQPLNDWNTSHVENMHTMFYNAKSFNQLLNNWNISNIQTMHHMFINAFSFDKNNISSWNCTNKFNSSMFNNKYIAYFTHIKNNIWLYVLFMLLLLFVFIYIC